MTVYTEELKNKVSEYWDKQSCGTQFTNKSKYSKDYFEEIERHRYFIEPEIFSFAQFTRYNGKKILEIGVGAGTDFIQWVRAGTIAYGVDLTPEAINNTKHRLKVYGLKAKELKIADCERLPFKDNFFDLVYSWGVIHHTPNTKKALEEIIRVCRPRGTCKIMVYNRHSLVSFFLWVRTALMNGKPWKSLSWCIYHHMESMGTKAFTKKEISSILKEFPVENVCIKPILTYYDITPYKKFGKFFQLIAKLVSRILGENNVGWFLTIEFTKKV